jgi:hypothetical protein
MFVKGDARQWDVDGTDILQAYDTQGYELRWLG